MGKKRKKGKRKGRPRGETEKGGVEEGQLKWETGRGTKKLKEEGLKGGAKRRKKERTKRGETKKKN